VKPVVWGAAIALAIGLAMPPLALGQAHEGISHQVSPDDTLELLAAEYYGDRRHAALLRLANGMDEPRDLRRGERIRIPVGQRVVTRAGDRLESLAATHLGDDRRATFLAEYNDVSPNALLAAGELLRLPFHLTYRARERVSLGVLGARYLRGSRDADILRAYNFLDEDVEVLSEGDTILIPALHIAVRAARLPRLSDGAVARVETRRAAQAEAEAALPAARHAWRRGDYEAVARRLAPLDLDYLDADVALEASLYLGGAHIARGDEMTAEAVFRAALVRDPDYEMSAYLFSPAIRTLWEQLGGRIDTSSR
jgi:hypothetical protein